MPQRGLIDIYKSITCSQRRFSYKLMSSLRGNYMQKIKVHCDVFVGLGIVKCGHSVVSINTLDIVLEVKADVFRLG